MKQIQIMRDDPVVTCEAGSARIIGRPGELFRLLVLSSPKTVPKRVIATLRETSEYTAASKIRYLRDDLALIGCGTLIETERQTGYRVALHDWCVDAIEFRSAIEALDGTFDEARERCPEPTLAKDTVKVLERMLGFWNANPGLGLPGPWAARFDVLKRKAEDRLLQARLCTHEPIQIREAIQELERRSRSSDAEDFIWRYLLLAYRAIGSLGQVDSTWDRILQYYKSAPPQALHEVLDGMRRGALNPFAPDHTEPVEPAERRYNAAPHGPEHDSLRELCAILGITTASQLRLEGSHLTPLACIRRARSRLYFMGVLASKWVADAAVRSEFKHLLTRLDGIKGEVRFLIIDPDGDGFRRLAELRRGHVSTESLVPLRKLASEHSSLQVRLYSNLPAFRIIVIDDDVVSFSAYRLAAEAYLTTDRGWESPHVVLDPLATYPLAEAFQLLFLETWHNARPLGGLE